MTSRLWTGISQINFLQCRSSFGDGKSRGATVGLNFSEAWFIYLTFRYRDCGALLHFVLITKFVKFVYIVYFFSRVPSEQICPKPESIATLPLFGPIEGQKWFDQISSQWDSQKNCFAFISFGKSRFKPPTIWDQLFLTTVSGKIEEETKSKRSEVCLFKNLKKIEAKQTRLIPEIGKIEAKKTTWIKVKRIEAVFLNLL